MAGGLELQSKVLVTQGADCNVVQSTVKLSVTKVTSGGRVAAGLVFGDLADRGEVHTGIESVGYWILRTSV